MVICEWTDIGDGVSVAYYSAYEDEPVNGLLWHHDCPHDSRGPESGGDAIPFAPLGPTGWTVEQWAPLTISPSVRCTLCNRHGWIRKGRWVPA